MFTCSSKPQLIVTRPDCDWEEAMRFFFHRIDKQFIFNTLVDYRWGWEYNSLVKPRHYRSPTSSTTRYADHVKESLILTSILGINVDGTCNTLSLMSSGHSVFTSKKYRFPFVFITSLKHVKLLPMAAGGRAKSSQ